MWLVEKKQETETDVDWKYDKSCGLRQGKLLRSGVHITSPPDWARDLSSGGPGVGRVAGGAGVHEGGGWQAVTSAAQNGRHAGARTGHEAAGLPDRPARARLALARWLPSTRLLGTMPYAYYHLAGGAFRSSRNSGCRMNPCKPSKFPRTWGKHQPASQSSRTNGFSCCCPIPHHSCNLISDGWVPSA